MNRNSASRNRPQLINGSRLIVKNAPWDGCQQKQRYIRQPNGYSINGEIVQSTKIQIFDLLGE